MANTNSNSGISVLGLLGVAFIVLKLTKVIDWSWWWVLLPFYGGILIALLLLGIALIHMSLSTKKVEQVEKQKYQSKFQQRLEEAMQKQREQQGK